jgi:hypothetical protein
MKKSEKKHSQPPFSLKNKKIKSLQLIEKLLKNPTPHFPLQE